MLKLLFLNLFISILFVYNADYENAQIKINHERLVPKELIIYELPRGSPSIKDGEHHKTRIKIRAKYYVSIRRICNKRAFKIVYCGV